MELLSELDPEKLFKDYKDALGVSEGDSIVSLLVKVEVEIKKEKEKSNVEINNRVAEIRGMIERIGVCIGCFKNNVREELGESTKSGFVKKKNVKRVEDLQIAETNTFGPCIQRDPMMKVEGEVLGYSIDYSVEDGIGIAAKMVASLIYQANGEMEKIYQERDRLSQKYPLNPSCIQQDDYIKFNSSFHSVNAVMAKAIALLETLSTQSIPVHFKDRISGVITKFLDELLINIHNLIEHLTIDQKTIVRPQNSKIGMVEIFGAAFGGHYPPPKSGWISSFNIGMFRFQLINHANRNYLYNGPFQTDDLDRELSALPSSLHLPESLLLEIFTLLASLRKICSLRGDEGRWQAWLNANHSFVALSNFAGILVDRSHVEMTRNYLFCDDQTAKKAYQEFYNQEFDPREINVNLERSYLFKLCGGRCEANSVLPLAIGSKMPSNKVIERIEFEKKVLEEDLRNIGPLYSDRCKKLMGVKEELESQTLMPKNNDWND